LLTSLGGFHMTERGAVSVKVKECFSHRWLCPSVISVSGSTG
jgi:hypothetical protein